MAAVFELGGMRHGCHKSGSGERADTFKLSKALTDGIATVEPFDSALIAPDALL